MAILTSRNRRARRREFAEQTRLRARFERRLNRQIADELRRAGNAAAEAFAHSGQLGVTFALADHDQRIEAILEPHYRRTMETFGQRVFDAAGKAGLKFETKDAAFSFEQFLVNWIAEHSAKRVTQISRTTRQQILDAILAARQ